MSYAFTIPVYNHPYYLADLVEFLTPFNLPIILVNDGSNVQTTQVIQNLAQQNNLIIVVEHAENKGKGQAVMTALKKADELGYSHILQIDADGQHHWEDVDKFLKASQQNPKAMVIGNPVFDSSVPKKRLYGRYATHIWVWINSLSFEIKDSMCGFRVYPVQASLDVMKDHKLRPRMGFDSEILVHLKWREVPFINIPTPVIYPKEGISHFDVWGDNIELSKMHASLFAGMLWRLPKLIRQKIKGKA